MAVASTAPIQIGRERAPAGSLSSTIGWLDGSSTRTPTTVSSCTALSRPLADAPNYTGRAAERVLRSSPKLRTQSGLHERRVQLHRQRRELTGDLFRPPPGFRIALPNERRHDLLDETDFAVGRGTEGTQVSRFEPEPAHLRDGLGDDQRVAVVVAPRLRGHQPELLDQVQLLRLDARGLDELAAREPKLTRVAAERLGAWQAFRRHKSARDLRPAAGSGRRLQAAVDGFEMLLDDAQRKVVVALRGQDVAQPRDVVTRELA